MTEISLRPEVSPHADACLVLADGSEFLGKSIGAASVVAGEICFNTGMTGYQEALTDPSYSGQIITFTFPHVGIVGCNADDVESTPPDGKLHRGAAGLVLRDDITAPSNFRSEGDFNAWLKARGIGGIAGVDTRALTRHIREKGAQNGVIFRIQESGFRNQVETMAQALAKLPDMKGRELAQSVSTGKPYAWTEGVWYLSPESRRLKPKSFHVVAIDYGSKLNILRSLAERGCKVTVVNARTSAEEILALKPDGVFLSNGPGDPAATGAYATPVIRALIDTGLPLFGICLGHQLLALAVGAKTEKMHQGHRGANHPVKNLLNGAVEITSQNHGFCVTKESLPANAEATHVSLFDHTLEGFRLKDKPVFAVQYHPESSPGPHDSRYLFDAFVGMMEKASGSRLQGSGKQ